MKVLLVYKKSTYQFYVIENKGIDLSDEDKENLKKSHEENQKSIKAVEEALDDLGIDYAKTYRANHNWANSKPDLVISVGGDGTFLEATKMMDEGQKILGVNSDPERSYGNYCCADRNNIKDILAQRERIKLEKRYRMSVLIDGDLCDIAMNDVLIHHASPAGLTRYVLRIEGKDEEHFCSGMWVSTASGSTGAISSFDGHQIAPESRYLSFKAFGLNKSKSDHYRSASGVNDFLTFQSKMREGKIYIDGQHLSYDFKYGQRLELESGSRIYLVTGVEQ